MDNLADRIFVLLLSRKASNPITADGLARQLNPPVDERTVRKVIDELVETTYEIGVCPNGYFTVSGGDKSDCVLALDKQIHRLERQRATQSRKIARLHEIRNAWTGILRGQQRLAV